MHKRILTHANKGVRAFAAGEKNPPDGGFYLTVTGGYRAYMPHQKT
jgi:hypothetical protein